MLTDERANEYALDLVSGALYTSDHVPQDIMAVVFMPLAFASAEQLTGIIGKVKGGGAVVASQRLHKTAGRAINGFPIFAEVDVLDADDAKRVNDKAKKLREAMD